MPLTVCRLVAHPTHTPIQPIGIFAFRIVPFRASDLIQAGCRIRTDVWCIIAYQCHNGFIENNGIQNPEILNLGEKKHGGQGWPRQRSHLPGISPRVGQISWSPYCLLSPRRGMLYHLSHPNDLDVWLHVHPALCPAMPAAPQKEQL